MTQVEEYGVDLGPDTGLNLAADQGPFAQHIEWIMSAEQGGQRGGIDCQRCTRPPFSDAAAWLLRWCDEVLSRCL